MRDRLRSTERSAPDSTTAARKTVLGQLDQHPVHALLEEVEIRTVVAINARDPVGYPFGFMKTGVASS